MTRQFIKPSMGVLNTHIQLNTQMEQFLLMERILSVEYARRFKSTFQSHFIYLQ